MREEIRIADGKGRITLPGFEHTPVIIEFISKNEFRIRKAKVVPVDETDQAQENGAVDLAIQRTKPGVIASIIEFLQSATPENPISKETLLDNLCHRFPNREREGMRSTIQTQLHNGLRRERGLNLQYSEMGYWIGK